MAVVFCTELLVSASQWHDLCTHSSSKSEIFVRSEGYKVISIRVARCAVLS